MRRGSSHLSSRQYGGHDDRSSQHHRGRHRERPAHPRRHPPGHRPQLQAVRLAPITRPTQRRTIRRVVVPTTGRRDQMVSLPGHPPPTLTAPTAPPQPWPLHDLQPHRRRELEAQRRAARCDRTGHPLPGHPRPQEQQPGNQPAHPHGTNDTHGRLPRGHSAPPTRAARSTRSGSTLSTSAFESVTACSSSSSVAPTCPSLCPSACPPSLSTPPADQTSNGKAPT
jgi:hypothetical protein